MSFIQDCFPKVYHGYEDYIKLDSEGLIIPGRIIKIISEGEDPFDHQYLVRENGLSKIANMGGIWDEVEDPARILNHQGRKKWKIIGYTPDLVFREGI